MQIFLPPLDDVVCAASVIKWRVSSIFQWPQIRCYAQVVALAELRERSVVGAMHRNPGEKGGLVFISFAACGRLMLSYILRCAYDPYDLLSCTIGLSRWDGSFYLRCHQSAFIILTLQFLEIVCLVLGCLHTQITHSHLSESDEITFCHLKWVEKIWKIALTWRFVVDKYLLSKYISFPAISGIIHLYAVGWHKHHDVLWLIWQKYNQTRTWSESRLFCQESWGC